MTICENIFHVMWGAYLILYMLLVFWIGLQIHKFDTFWPRHLPAHFQTEWVWASPPPLSGVGGRGMSPKPEVHWAAQIGFLCRAGELSGCLGGNRYKSFSERGSVFCLILLIIALFCYLLWVRPLCPTPRRPSSPSKQTSEVDKRGCDFGGKAFARFRKCWPPTIA